jgi:hypothetical protein
VPTLPQYQVGLGLSSAPIVASQRGSSLSGLQQKVWTQSEAPGHHCGGDQHRSQHRLVQGYCQ